MNTKGSSEIMPSLSIDCVVFGFQANTLKVLFIKRSIEPAKKSWALPGGFINKNEDIDQAAKRILYELTNVSNIFLEQVQAFGKADRFPVGRVITIGYYALVKPEKYKLNPSAHASMAEWFNIKEKISLPFDHDLIFETALKKLQKKIRNEPVGFELMPNKFTLTQLQKLYESIEGIELDTRNFRKKLMNMKLLFPLDEKQKGVNHRAARLYRFDRKKYKELQKKGFVFDL